MSTNRFRLLVGVAVAVAVLSLAALALPDPAATDFAAILARPSAAHPLGTDQLGRDVLARLVVGGGTTLGLTLGTVLLTGLVGSALGLLAGYHGGPLGRLFLRVVDVLAALPTVLFGLLAAAVLGPGLPALLAAMWLVAWTPFARQAYQLTARETGREYVEAAVALGAGPLRVRAHIVGNIAPPLLTHAAVRVTSTMLTISGLSFLGLGVQPPTPEWGAMVAEGREYLFVAPHVTLAPAAAVIAAATAITVLGRRGEAALLRR